MISVSVKIHAAVEGEALVNLRAVHPGVLARGLDPL